MSGYIAIQRGLLNHPAFKKEPFTEREAWIWLIEEAAWKPKTVRVGDALFSLNRGELAHACRYMAKAWGWHHLRVWRFLQRLEKRSMIETLAERDATHITICNYDKYQSPRNADETPSETLVKHSRNKEEPLNHLTKEDDDDAGALVSEKSNRIADEVATICGHDLGFIPPAWHGAPYRVQSWLAQGWPEEIILSSCREQIAKKRDGPPDRIQYFEKGIAAAIARAKAPLPEVQFIEAETVEVRRGKSETVVDAAKRFERQLASLGPRPGSFGGQTDNDPVRLLPPGGRERS